MGLAEGKVVLALEGGYDKQSLCDCSEICLNALTSKQIPAFPGRTLDAVPNKPASEDLENVIQIQSMANFAALFAVQFSINFYFYY